MHKAATTGAAFHSVELPDHRRPGVGALGHRSARTCCMDMEDRRVRCASPSGVPARVGGRGGTGRLSSCWSPCMQEVRPRCARA